MADIQYINYGDQQVDQQALLNKMADQVAMYVNKQPWSRKRKEKFMSAYSDMLTRGIVGADSNTGQWVITVNGDDLNVDNLPKKDKQMYQEAAYFIKNQMASLAQAKPEEKKEEKTPYGNFREGFLKHVSNNMFGGNPVETEKWNNFDERNQFGIRDTKNRTEMLSKLLQSYSDSITDDKFNFEGTPYKNAAELKGKIQSAINALGTESKQDDLESFYALGLDPDEWFNNGSGDPSGHFRKNGTQFTNGEYYQYLKDKVKKVKQDKLSDEKLKQYKSLLSSIDETNATLQRFGSTESTNYNYNTAGLVADISSMLGDITSLAGGPVGIGGGLWSLGSDLVGDIIKGKSFGDVAGNALGNLLWTAAGAVPGARVGKLVKTVSRIYAAAAPYIMAQSPSVQKTWKKLLSGDFNLSNEDIENVKLTMHAITGGANAIRGARTDRQVTARVKNTTGEIRLTNGKTKTLNKEQLTDVVRIGNRKGQKAAVDKAEEYLGLKEGEAIVEGQFNFSKNGSKWYQPSYYSQRYRDNVGTRWYIPGRSRANIVDLGKVQQLRTQLATQPNRSFRSTFTRNNDKFFSRIPRLEMAQSLNRYLPEGQQFNTQPFFNKKYREQFNQSQQQPTQQNPSANTGGTQSGVSSNITKLTQDQYKELQSTLRGTNYSGNPVVEGAGAVKGIGDVYVIKDPSGRDLFQLQIRGKDGKTYQTSYVEPSKFKEEALKTTKEVMRANISKETNRDLRHKINLDLILELKRVGALKQGGRINKQKIQKYKEYIKI